MEIRPIDANALQELCNRGIQNMWNTGVAPVSWAAAYADFKNDIDSIPTLTPQNEWVSVEDRLPASGQNVIATNGSDVGEAWYASLSRSWYRYNGLEWNRICREVTHWMPLPKSPKEDE